jgi:hypothetical protein
MKKIIFAGAVSCLQKFLLKMLQSINVQAQISNLNVLVRRDEQFVLN